MGENPVVTGHPADQVPASEATGSAGSAGSAAAPAAPAAGEPDAVAADLLVEEVSIDGMCGVY
jgi:mycofactocin precursor